MFVCSSAADVAIVPDAATTVCADGSKVKIEDVKSVRFDSMRRRPEFWIKIVSKAVKEAFADTYDPMEKAPENENAGEAKDNNVGDGGVLESNAVLFSGRSDAFDDSANAEIGAVERQMAQLGA